MDLKKLKYDSQGLVPAIIQDVENNEVLMVAYMNEDSIKKTMETGKTHFWSRSRRQYWMKGESSGHTQEVKEIYFDCDADALLIKVTQNVAACHTGYRTCFYRKIDPATGNVEEMGERMFDPDKTYGGK